MIRITTNREPYWLDIGHGLRLQVRPCGSSVIRAAQRDLAACASENDDRALVFLKAVARAAIIDWDGVCDEEETPAVVTPAFIDALMDHAVISAAFEIQYLHPHLLMEEEKNGSRPALNGVTAAGPDTAPAVVN